MKNIENNKGLAYTAIFAIAVAKAFLNEIFVYPNSFAPSGVSGIAAMIQHSTGISEGFVTFAINIPLLIIAWKELSKPYALKTVTYLSAFSVANIIFQRMDFSGIAFLAKDGGEAIMASVAAGVFGGLSFATCLKLGGCTGGTDIIAAYFNKKKPEYDMVWVNSALTGVVAFAAFFVYGKNYASVILCLIYIFVSSLITDRLLKGAKQAIQFEVFTKNPEEMSRQIMTELAHGCTLIRAEGMYSHRDVAMIVCVVNKRQVVDFENIINQYPGSFAVISSVNSTFGNFKKVK